VEKIMLQMFEGMLKLFVSTILIVVAGTLLVYGDENNNVSGDNTLISGGYTSSSSTTYESGSSSNTTSTSTTNNTSNIKSFPPTASAPPAQSGLDVCNIGTSFGMQSSIIGLSSSTNQPDVTCERIKLARELSQVHNMKLAGIAVLCQDLTSFYRYGNGRYLLAHSLGKIGDDAERLWQKYDILRPDYDEYIKNKETKREGTSRTSYVL
jgi:hypothetical protein